VGDHTNGRTPHGPRRRSHAAVRTGARQVSTGTGIFLRESQAEGREGIVRFSNLVCIFEALFISNLFLLSLKFMAHLRVTVQAIVVIIVFVLMKTCYFLIVSHFVWYNV
jgi:hypothetical protein